MKKYLLLATALLGMTSLSAQSSLDDDDLFGPSNTPSFSKDKSYNITVGPRVGLALTTMSQPDECDLADGAGAGFSGGAALRVRLGRMSENSDGGTGLFGFNLDLKYKQNRVKTIGSDDLSISYFEVPLTAQFYPFYKNTALNGLYLETGLDIAGTLSKSPDYLTVYPDNGRYSRIVYNTGSLKGFDCRIPLGIGYTARGGFDVNLRYYIGTSDLAENLGSKMSTVELSLGWFFKVVK